MMIGACSKLALASGSILDVVGAGKSSAIIRGQSSEFPAGLDVPLFYHQLRIRTGGYAPPIRRYGDGRDRTDEHAKCFQFPSRRSIPNSDLIVVRAAE